ncbi:MAG: tRNA (N6-isopentenyl adenosine(37)-C2)-methylthiotransferase MiaB [Planctomycetota bacterium]
MTAGTASHPPKIFLETFGCQMNVLDSEILLSRMERESYQAVDQPWQADLICFNTCAVRDHAEARVRGRLGELKRLKRERPHLIIAVVGCMAQREGASLLKQWPHVDIVCGPREVLRMPELVSTVRRTMSPVLALGQDQPMRVLTELRRAPRSGQAYVSIMRGCDKYCSFCIVPKVRGVEQSKPVSEVVAEVTQLVLLGARDVTLLGQTVNSYGKRLGKDVTLASLLRELERIDGLVRLRFITSFPTLMSDELIATMAASRKISRYLHLPVQSGSDAVLKAMRRGYTVAEYLAIAAKLKAVPGLELATDVIVGFPGETEADFLATEALLRELRFTQAFVFKYSPRPGTAAAERLIDDVPESEKARRNRHLLKVQEAIQLEKNRARIGLRELVHVEGPSKKDPSRLTGRTDHFRIVHFAAPAGAAPGGGFAEVAIESATPLTLAGRFERAVPWQEVDARRAIAGTS